MTNVIIRNGNLPIEDVCQLKPNNSMEIHVNIINATMELYVYIMVSMLIVHVNLIVPKQTNLLIEFGMWKKTLINSTQLSKHIHLQCIRRYHTFFNVSLPWTHLPSPEEVARGKTLCQLNIQIYSNIQTME